MEILNNDYRDMVACLQKEGVEFMLVEGCGRCLVA